ncbi:MAG: hypothetical protein U0263_34740 [Polyangiaceae bacterium]
MLSSLALGGCADDDEGGTSAPPEKPEGGVPLLGADCDPMVPEFCALPFPSNVYLDDDPSGRNPSGKSVRFGATTLPKPAKSDLPCSPELLYDHDGFSPSQAPMTYLARAALGDSATPFDIGRSLEDDSPTVLLDADTLERVPHWVDIDANTADGDELDRRLFMLRPAMRLKNATRYIVAIRHIDDLDGKPIAPSPVFRALRDGKELESPTQAERWTVYARRALYKDIFAKLAAAGVDRSDLQVAWDFTTATGENITQPVLSMRDKALAVVGEEGPTFVVKSVTEYPDVSQSPDLLRRIELVMKVPLFLTQASTSFDENQALDRLNVDEKGELVQNGSMDLDVLVLVPRSVQSGKKHGLLQNGHGLFGDRFEGADGFLAKTANAYGWVVFATNLFGFDGESTALAAQGLLGRCEALKSFPERQVQGMVNQLLAMRMMLGRVAKSGIKDSTGALVLDPAWIDASLRAYRGDSQGGIMGATYMALSTDVTRGLLGEPGMSYNLMLPRSVDFLKYSLLMNTGFGFDPVANQLVLGMIQMSWDRTEPSGFATHVESDPFPGTPAHHVLLHVARGDHQVTNFSAHLMARAIGAVQLASDDAAKPVWEDLYGIGQESAPLEGKSALVEYEFGLAPNPTINKANTDGCDPHDRVRLLTPSFAQQDEFFRTGRIAWHCQGACNCSDDSADPNEEEGCDQSQKDLCK